MYEFYLGSINLDIFSKESLIDIISYDFLFKVKICSSNEIQIIDIIHQLKNFKLSSNLKIGSIIKFDVIFNKKYSMQENCNLIINCENTPVYKDDCDMEYINFDNNNIKYFNPEYSYLYATPSLNYLVKNVIYKNKLLKETDIIKILANESTNYKKIKNLTEELEKMKDMLKNDVVYFGTPERDFQFWNDYIDKLIDNINN